MEIEEIQRTARILIGCGTVIFILAVVLAILAARAGREDYQSHS